MQVKKIYIMEVCGTHTMSIAKYGLKNLFPKEVKMLSGPGCPICVTPVEEIDKAVAISKIDDVIITTFGDMMHVPGSVSSLEKERADGADIRVVYSPADALKIAEENKSKKIVFLGVGFETTVPVIGAVVLMADRRKIKNFFILPMFKTIPNALRAILNIKERKIDGFILPGHVSTIIGTNPYTFISKEFKTPGVIAGFGSFDILKAVEMLISQIKNKKSDIELQYKSAVNENGNKTAQQIIIDVFKNVDSNWRGIGIIKNSGLTFNTKYQKYDASKIFQVFVKHQKTPRACMCGQILLGLKNPRQCKLFSKACTPAHPVGPCMVSSEGACSAEFKYGLMQ